jgi:hypothetical protein
MAKLLKNPSGVEIVKKTLSVAGPTGGTMGKVSKKASGTKLSDIPDDTEIIRNRIIESEKPKFGRMKGVTVVTRVGGERLTAMPTMRNISGSTKSTEKPKQTTTATTTTKRPQKGTVGHIKKVVTEGIKQDNKMGGVIPPPAKPIVKEVVKEVVKEKPIATFGRGTHQSAFPFYPSQVTDFVKGNKEWAALIDTSSPETIKASIEKLPADFVLSTNPKEAKKGKQTYSEQSKDAFVRLLVKKYGEGKSLL